MEKMELRNGGSSSNSTVDDGEGRKEPFGAVRQYRKTKMPRMRWTDDLHLCFTRAVEMLGGPDQATPKMIFELMDVKGLSMAQVKSHLQMYRNKKEDERGQGIVDSIRNTVEGEERQIHSFSHLQMLHDFHQKCLATSSLFNSSESTSWGSHGNWNTVGLRFYGSVESYTNNGSNTHNFNGRRRVFDLHHDGEADDPQFRPREVDYFTESRKASQYCNTGNEQMRGRIDADHEPNLNLSLSIVPKQQLEKRKRGWEKEEVDSSLSLSLFSSSRVQEGKHARLAETLDPTL